jgi:hypothetical protein
VVQETTKSLAPSQPRPLSEEETWLKDVADMPADRQVAAVAEKLKN